MTTSNAPSALSAQVRRASLIIAAAMLLSAALGVVRQAVIGSAFGAGTALDSFYAAYRIPEFLFTLLVGGAFASAFIPVYTRFVTQNDPAGAWRLANGALTFVTLSTLAAALIAILLAPQITAVILLPGRSSAEQTLAADLMRIMLWTVVIFGISGLMIGILNANQRFLTPALAPSLNNIGLILGAVLLASRQGIHGLAWGAVLGALFHLALQLLSLRALRAPLALNWKPATPGLGEVLRLMIPRMIGSAAIQINFLVNTALASGMATGSLTALTVSFSLMFVVLGVVGQSMGTAIFPTLSRLGAAQNLDDFRRTLAEALRGMLFTSVPAMLGMIGVALPLVMVVYERGNWTHEASLLAATALGWWSLGLPAFALQEILTRAFYALRDTRTPVAVAVGGVALNIVLSLILVRVFPASLAFCGLALANVIATALEDAALWVLLGRRVGSLHERFVLDGALRTGLAAGLMLAALVVILPALESAGLPVFVQLVGASLAGALIFEALAVALGLPEARRIPLAILRRVRPRSGG